MRVEIKRGDVQYHCTSEEQLALFLSRGYKVVEDKKKTTSSDRATSNIKKK